MRSTFPGGLRAQVLLGLTVLLVASFGAAAVLVENVLTRRLLAAREAHLQSVAKVAPGLGPRARDALLTHQVIDALVVGSDRRGPPELVSELTDANGPRFVEVDGSLHLCVRDENVLAASAVDDVQSAVASARTMLLVFGLLIVIVVLALGYGLFSFVVVRPIRAIGVATERAAQGDLASAITVLPRNEIGNVAHSFNEMLRRIDRNQEELELKVAELQAANDALEATRDSLVRSEKLASVGQLAAGIAHEIGNPLAALSGYNELLRSGTLDADEAEDLLLRSSEQLDRIRSVIRNLLDFSRDESTAEPGPTDLAQCVDETVSLVRASARKKRVEFEVDEIDGPLVNAVSSQVVQVLVNLAMNAVDALEEGGRVRFRRVDSELASLIVVEDDGPGVPAEDAPRIFDPFFTTKEPGDGTGLGLAISARIAEALGGELRLGQSELGGACFVFELRRQPGEEDGNGA